MLHETTKTRLASLMKNPPQALVLAGPRGVGVESAAYHVATSLTSQPEMIVPKKRSGSHFVEDREAGSIIIEDIRALYGQTRSKLTKPRVFILDFGDRTMTHGAQNAFLKLLEEPQPNIHFILATHHPEFLLPTIASRCQRVNIRPITKVQSLQLIDELGISDPTKKARIQYIAEGLPAEITHLAADDTYYEQRVTAIQDAKAVLEGTSYQRMILIKKYKDQRPRALELIDDILFQLKKSLGNTQDERIVTQINTLVGAYDKIRQNGNIQLQLTRVLL